MLSYMHHAIKTHRAQCSNQLYRDSRAIQRMMDSNRKTRGFKARASYTGLLQSVTWMSSLPSSSGVSSLRHTVHTMMCWRWRTSG